MAAQRGPLREAAAVAVVALILLLVVTPAAAQEARLNVSFEVEPDAVPTHLCVLVPATSKMPPSFPSEGDKGKPCEVSDQVLFKDLDDRYVDNEVERGTIDGSVYRARKGPEDLKCDGPLIEALKGLLPDSKECLYGSRDACEPAIRLGRAVKKEDRIVCTTNGQPNPHARNHHEKRVAVLDLNATASTVPPTLDALVLEGTAAVLQLGGNVGRRPGGLVLSVVGGHYLGGESRATAGAQLVLQLIPLCGEHTVKLPPQRLAVEGRPDPPKLEVSVQQEASDKQESERVCVLKRLDAQDQGLSVVLPYNKRTGTRTLVVTRKDVVLHAQWSEVIPPRVLDAGVHSLRFSWVRHCLHTGGCPKEPYLVESGTHCYETSSDARVCRYECTAGEAGPFRLPARVRMTSAVGDGKPDDVWEDEIHAANEQLLGYLPTTERHVWISFSNWQEDGSLNGKGLEEITSRPGERITHVEIQSAHGGLFRLKPDAHRVRVRVPELGCSDYLSYRMIGDRRYREVTEKPEDGELKLDAPRTLVDDEVSLALALGGGWQFPPIGFSEGWEGLPYGVVEGILVVRWWPEMWPYYTRFRPYFEVRGGVILTQLPFQTLLPAFGDAVAAGGEGATEGVWYLRIPFTLDAVWRPFGHVYLGLGVGPVIGFPMRAVDRDRAFTQVRLGATLIGGRRLSPGVAMEIEGRWIVDESMYRYTFDYRGAPRGSAVSVQSFFVDGRLRFDLR